MTTYRLFGPRFAEPEGYLDADMTSVDPRNGTAILTATDGSGRSWSIDIQRLGRLMDDNLVYEYETKPGVKLWEQVLKLGTAADAETDTSTSEDIIEAARWAFTAAVQQEQ